MFIGGLKWETTQEKLKAYFGKFGHIIECVIMTDNFTGRSRGFGFVTFEDPKVLDRVLKQDHTIDGKIVDPKRAVPKDEQDKTEKIFVGGIPMDVTNDEFGEYFEKYGVVLDASLMFDKNTGRSRGFGFITFDDSEAVNMVMAAQADKELRMHGRRIEIKQATPRLRQGVSQDGNGPNRRKTNRFEPYKKPLGLPIHSAYGGPTIDKLTYQRLGPQNGQTIDNRSYGRHSSRSSSPTRDEYVVELTRK
ncbi:hypothetical protein BC833DRAFT_578513 [Globomyces pollinis-pini]|nr:hypothetical protein BC833DRAFT_578513 [Globomyces pollinis-pini]